LAASCRGILDSNIDGDDGGFWSCQDLY
jgi:hypothetical protein